MHGVTYWTAELEKGPTVKSTLSVGKSVHLEFGEQVSVWLRPSQAERLAQDLRALLDELAAA